MSNDEEEWVFTREEIDPNDPLIAAPRWRDALNQIIGLCESLEEHHTGFRHIRRIAESALGRQITR